MILPDLTGKEVRLNLGSGPVSVEGFLGVDFHDQSNADIVADLNTLPWPWEDNSVDEILTRDCLEHLYPLGRSEGQLNIIAIMREIHRILKPGGVVNISVPSTDGRGAFQDPTHVTFWNQNTFAYFYNPQMHAARDYPLFTCKDPDCYITTTRPTESKVVWAEARLRKPK